MNTLVQNGTADVYRFSTTEDPVIEAKIEYINEHRCPDATLHAVVECINNEVAGNHDHDDAPDWYRVAIIEVDETGGDGGEQ